VLLALIFSHRSLGFIYEKDSFGGKDSGLLVVQDFEEDRDVQDLDEQRGPIRIVEASELEDNIGDLISEKLDIQFGA